MSSSDNRFLKSSRRCIVLKIMIDKAPSGTITTETPGGASLSLLKDRDLSSYVAVGSSLKVCVDLGSNDVPVNCIALFGLSSDMLGGRIEIIKHVDIPVAGDWPATGSYTYSFDIYGDRVYCPLPEIGYDATNKNFYRYYLCLITPGATTAPTMSELAIGLTEAPCFNYQWGRTHQQGCQIEAQRTVAGIEYRHQRNAIYKNDFEIQWESMSEQGIYQVRRWWSDVGGGLYPVVLIPDDNRIGDKCYYSYLPKDVAEVERFCDQRGFGLQLSEAIGYEAGTA